MKCIRQALLKILSGHDSVHRRTDSRIDRRTTWNQYTPISTLLEGGGIKILETPFFRANIRHHRAAIDVRNKKMNRGQETQSKRLNARYQMNWAFFFQITETPFSAKYLTTRGPQLTLETRKWVGIQETHPIRLNGRYERNWANSFIKKFQKPHFQPNIWPAGGQNWC